MSSSAGGSERLERVVDIVAAGVAIFFTFALPLPDSSIPWRGVAFQIAGWTIFLLIVGLLWGLHRTIRRTSRRAASTELILHFPFLVSLLLLTVPARRISMFVQGEPTRIARAGFLSALSWYAALLAIGLASLALLAGSPSSAPIEDEAGPELDLDRSRRRVIFAASALAALTALFLPIWGGAILLVWTLFPLGFHLERRRLLRLNPSLKETLEQ